MSTFYKLRTPVEKQDLLQVLYQIGVIEIDCGEDSNEDQFCVGDGCNFIWCFTDPLNKVDSFCRYGDNYDAEHFIKYAADELHNKVFSEDDDNYWQEEIDDGEIYHFEEEE